MDRLYLQDSTENAWFMHQVDLATGQRTADLPLPVALASLCPTWLPWSSSIPGRSPG